MRNNRLLVAAAAAALVCYAGETRFWTQDDMSDFEKGNLTRLSLRSDGRLMLAPVVKELLDSSVAYLWALARDSKGTLYAGGGAPGASTAKLFAIDAQGRSRTVAEVEGLEIHAIAIDRQDRVYVASNPDGKVYRIGSNGKPELFYDPHAKYIWAMAFSSKGDLYIATGDQGDIYRVTPGGKGSVFFQTEETHARSLTLDAQDNLIVGTEPSGLILRITPAGEGFVLYQAAKREITAVAVTPDGTIYAAGVGNKQPGAPIVTQAPVPLVPITPTGSQPAAQSPGTAIALRPSLIQPPTFGSAAASIAGGSDVYRIGKDGDPRTIWSHPQDVVYALAISPQGRPIVGTGNKGNVYRIDGDRVYTQLVNLAPTQVTDFASDGHGRIFAATGNVGKVFQIGPELEKQGSIESEVFDVGAFSYWGRLSFRGNAAGGSIAFETRTGNLSRPQKNWSPWRPAPVTGDGGRIASPSARFVQYRATLTSANGQSPELSSVDVAYLAKNVSPTVDELEITPPNYRFPVPSTPLSTPPSLSLPPLGRKRTSSPSTLLELGAGTPSMPYAKGFLGARWLASDENDDTLIYKVEIRGTGEKDWKLLRDNVREKYLSWDSTGFADGEYVLRVTASDAPSNPPAQALENRLVSDPFLIDNTPPGIAGLRATPQGNKIEVRWKAADALSDLGKAEYSVNGGDWLVVEPATKLTDSRDLEFLLVIDRPAGGECTVAVRVADEYDNQTVEKVVVK